MILQFNIQPIKSLFCKIIAALVVNWFNALFLCYAHTLEEFIMLHKKLDTNTVLNIVIPPPPAHSPRISIKPKQNVGMFTRKRAKVMPTSDLPEEAATPRVVRPRHSIIKMIATRGRADVTPTTSEEPKKERRRPIRPPSLRKAMRPLEEYEFLRDMKPEDRVSSKGRYRGHWKAISDGTNYLLASGMHNPDNQAAIVMAKKNALLVARALQTMRDHNIELTDNLRLALIRVGNKADDFVRVLVDVYNSFRYEENVNKFIQITLKIEKLAEIFGSVDPVTAKNLTDLFSGNFRSIVSLINGFNNLIDKNITITNEMIHFVGSSLSKSSAAADIFKTFERIESLKNSSASEVNRSSSASSANPYVMFQGVAADRSNTKVPTHSQVKCTNVR